MIPLNFVTVTIRRHYQTILTQARPYEHRFNEIIWSIKISIYSKMVPLNMQFNDQNEAFNKFKIYFKPTKVILVYFL